MSSNQPANERKRKPDDASDRTKNQFKNETQFEGFELCDVASYPNELPIISDRITLLILLDGGKYILRCQELNGKWKNDEELSALKVAVVPAQVSHILDSYSAGSVLALRVSAQLASRFADCEVPELAIADLGWISCDDGTIIALCGEFRSQRTGGLVEWPTLANANAYTNVP